MNVAASLRARMSCGDITVVKQECRVNRPPCPKSVSSPVPSCSNNAGYYHCCVPTPMSRLP
eukprot:7062921-Pyramimonas_sp.AAC.1